MMERRADPECQKLLEGGSSAFIRIQRPQDLVRGWSLSDSFGEMLLGKC